MYLRFVGKGRAAEGGTGYVGHPWPGLVRTACQPDRPHVPGCGMTGVFSWAWGSSHEVGMLAANIACLPIIPSYPPRLMRFFHGYWPIPFVGMGFAGIVASHGCVTARVAGFAGIGLRGYGFRGHGRSRRVPGRPQAGEPASGARSRPPGRGAGLRPPSRPPSRRRPPGRPRPPCRPPASEPASGNEKSLGG
jgi:hypothetical protein